MLWEVREEEARRRWRRRRRYSMLVCRGHSGTGQRLSGRGRGRPKLCSPRVSLDICSKAFSSGLPRLQVEIWAILDAAEQSTSVSRVSLSLAWQGPHSRLKWLEKHQGDCRGQQCNLGIASRRAAALCGAHSSSRAKGAPLSVNDDDAVRGRQCLAQEFGCSCTCGVGCRARSRAG